MARALAKKAETSTTLLEAAKKVLRQNGHSGLSTRDVATAAGVPLSQIHYHFGSKQGLMLALFDYLNAQLLDRQNAMFHDSALTLSQRWDRACDYLDEDIASGYVRVLQELIAASWLPIDVGPVDLRRGGTLTCAAISQALRDRRHALDVRSSSHADFQRCHHRCAVAGATLRAAAAALSVEPCSTNNTSSSLPCSPSLHLRSSMSGLLRRVSRR